MTKPRVTVVYGSKCVKPENRIYAVMTEPCIPYVGAILEVLFNPFVWYPLLICAALLCWRLFA